MSKFVFTVFMILACATAGAILYELFFVGGDILGVFQVESALDVACRAVETPMSRDYYRYVMHVNVNSHLGITENLGIVVKDGVTDLDSDDNELLFDYPMRSTVQSATGYKYSTGWN